MGLRELRERYLPAFNDFFEAYPRKVDRIRSLDIYCELAEEGCDLGEILAKAESYGRNVDPAQLKYVPSPRSWLRDRRWEDHDLFTDQVVSQREWFVGAWARADTKSVSEKFGFIYTHPPIPEGVEDLDAWHKDQRKIWIGLVARHILYGEAYPE